MLKDYYQLTKPGIIYGNLFTAVAGFLLASGWRIDFLLLLATLLGTGLIIGSACVFNNVIDRDIDKKMARTKVRALVTGAISPASALIYGTILGVLGFGLLAVATNWLTVLVGAVGFIDYIVFYGISKRRGPYGTLVGSIAGAVPPVAGYTAVSGQFDTAALLLFLILVFWQMPHFYSIAMYRLKDYKAAGLPVLPAVKGMAATKRSIFIYIGLFTLTLPLLSVYRYLSPVFFVLAVFIGLGWLYEGIRKLKLLTDEKWARRMFFVSLLVLTSSSILICLDSVIRSL